MQIKLSLTEIGAKVLHAHGIESDSYKPAYNGESVGLDLYNAGPTIIIPGRNKWAVFDEPAIYVPTGIKLALPRNTVGLIKERGSVTKTGLFIRAGVVDPGYTDEVFINFVNLGEKDTQISSGGKLPAQLIVVPCFTDFTVISTLEYLEQTDGSLRETGSLGSSDEEGSGVA